MEINELYRKFFYKIRHYVYQMIENWHDAEDITQDAFLSYLCIDKSDKVMNGSINYLYRSARNKAIDYMRRKETKDQYIDVEQIQGESDGYNDFRIKEREFDNYYTVKKLYEEIKNMRGSQSRTVLLKRYFDGMGYDEIAVDMNITHRTLYNHKNRGLDKLREKFGVLKK